MLRWLCRIGWHSYPVVHGRTLPVCIQCKKPAAKAARRRNR